MAEELLSKVEAALLELVGDSPQGRAVASTFLAAMQDCPMAELLEFLEDLQRQLKERDSGERLKA
jgi:hypothetical protein